MLPRDTPPLSMDQHPTWHSLPNLFQAYSFIGMKNGTKASSCWTRPGSCPGDHPRWGDPLGKQLNTFGLEWYKANE